MRGSVAVLLVLGLLSSAPTVTAILLPSPQSLDDPTPNAPNAIQARYTFALQPSLSAFAVEIRLQVMEAEVHGPQGLPAQAIRDGGPAVRTLFEDTVRSRIGQELQRAFPESTATLTSLSFDYGASDADANPYTPPVTVAATAALPLTGALLGMPEIRAQHAADWARAFFYSGGAARIERTLPIPAGFDAAIRIEVPDELQLASPGRKDASSAEFTKNNMRGVGTLSLYVRFEVGLRPQEVPQAVLDGPLVRATFRADDATPLWLQAIPFSKGRYVADLDLRIDLPSLSASTFDEGVLPANLRLEHVSADLMRVAVREGVVGGAELEGYFHALIQESLREDFGQDVVVTMDSRLFQESLAQPVGGSTVRPLLVAANARLPIESDQMLSSSAMARSVGMITGTTGDFDLRNDGTWGLELTLLYPKGAAVKAGDSLDRLQEIQEDGREGFRVYLAPGESTTIDVWGRPSFDVAVFIIGLTELAVLVTGAIYLARWTRARARARKFPWSGQGT